MGVRAGGRREFERAARLKLEETGARRIDGGRCRERTRNVERAVVEHGWLAVRAGQRPGRAGIDHKRLEMAESGVHSIDRACATAARKLQGVRAAAVCADLSHEHRAGIDHEAIGGTSREIDGVASARYRARVRHRAASGGEDAERTSRNRPRRGVCNEAARVGLEIDANAACTGDLAGIGNRPGLAFENNPVVRSRDRPGRGIRNAAAIRYEKAVISSRDRASVCYVAEGAGDVNAGALSCTRNGSARGVRDAPAGKQPDPVVHGRDESARVHDRAGAPLDDNAVLAAGDRAGVGDKPPLGKADAVGNARDRRVIRDRADATRDEDTGAGALSGSQLPKARDRPTNIIRDAAARA